jgi:NDP-sugar pyrophosphorylase family protein
LPARKAIVRGKFPRQAFHKVYFWRRVYGTCWTQVFYFKPIYSFILAIPLFKKLVFRLFGYKGNMNFVVYPDTWIRDLPILDIGDGAYLSNRATIGTNICLPSGHILVDGIKVGKKGLVGHLTMLAPGVTVGDGAEIGVGCPIGIRTVFEAGVSIKPAAVINHGAVVRSASSIGTHSYLGLRSEIGPNLHIPSCTIVPEGASIQSKADIDKLISSEAAIVQNKKEDLAGVLANYLSEAR